jgi:signal peptidase I
MAEAGIRLTKTRISQKLDMNDLVGKDISGDLVLIRKIAQGVIDYMVTRAGEGRGIDRVKLRTPYSERYAQSLPFKAAGKSKNKVNMRLSGDMLRALDILEEDGPTVVIGIDDEVEAIKAYGHQTGFEGHPTIPQDVYRRPFFGVTKNEFQKFVLPKFKDDIDASAGSRTMSSLEEQNKAIEFIQERRTLGELFDLIGGIE